MSYFTCDICRGHSPPRMNAGTALEIANELGWQIGDEWNGWETLCPEHVPVGVHDLGGEGGTA